MRTGPAGEALAVRLGRASASLPGSSLRPDAAFDGGDQQRRSVRYAKHLTAIAPALKGRVDELIDTLGQVLADYHGARGRRRALRGRRRRPPGVAVLLPAFARHRASGALVRAAAAAAVPDLGALVARVAASVSQCGYNTAMELLQIRTPALVEPHAPPVATR